MSKVEAESKKTGAPGTENHHNDQDDIENYAQSTIREMLGWYGLQDGGGVAGGGGGGEGVPNGPSANIKLLATSRVEDSEDHKPPSGGVPNKDNTLSGSLPYTNGWDTRPLHAIDSYNSPESPPVSEGRRGGSRKLIGMRYLFTPLADHLSLLEKAKIWVTRHDYKYFVGWTEEQLSKVDPVFRPISTISPEMYKLHMNRSEYCRNVKLKYCLEAETHWAKEFQEKLAKPASKGGFSGLCQAKIAAAELWRKYSENYKSHQARYPNPKSKYRTRRSGSDIPSPDGSTCSGKAEDLDTDIKEMEENSLHGTEGQESHVPEENLPVGPLVIKPELEDHCENAENENSIDLNSPIMPMSSAVSISEGEAITSTPSAASLQEINYPTPSPISFSPFLPSPVVDYSAYHTNPLLQAKAGGPLHSPGLYPSLTDKKPVVFRPSEYKKSERGLSYLFPSLADQQLSLLDKVKVTVMRHKNNYFMNWSEEELKKIDPIVRPKMIVTKDLYKEYCHRNAMKYDSNLQFCMESPEAWAQDFRDRLAKPPSEGGFHSLCEVKQEAGRLWKEHSGRYKMHNVVKAQMDMNSEASEHIRSEMYVKKRGSRSAPHEMSRSHYGSTNSSPVPDDRHSPGSTQSSPSIASSLQRPLSRYSPAGVNATPFTPHSSPYGSVTDISVDESRKRRRMDDSCSSSASSPPNIDDGEAPYKQARHLVYLQEGGMNNRPVAQYMAHTTCSMPLPMPLSLPPAEEVKLTPPDGDSLFQPLPSSLSVSQQIAVWMERHRNNYYLDVSADAIQLLHPLLKPHFIVSEAVYQRFISKGMVTMFDHMFRIVSSSHEWATRYQERLAKDCVNGGFASIAEALAEAVDLWNRYLSDDKGPCHRCRMDNCNCLQSMQPFQHWTGVGHKGTSPEISSPATQDGSVRGMVVGGLQGYATSATNLSQSDLSNQEALDLSIPSSASSTSNGNSAQGDTAAAGGGAGGNGGEAPIWTRAWLMGTLWNSRERLREALREDPSCSWHTRLEPHLNMLRQHLHPDYMCPLDAADCRVDLVLAILQQQFAMAVQQ